MVGKQGQRMSFEAVYEQYYDRVYHYVYTLLLNKEEAEDVTEEAFLAAYVHYDGYDENKASVATWLTRIAHNCAVNLLRSAAHAKHAEMPEEWEPTDDKDFTAQVDSSQVMMKVYEKLSQDERTFLNLRYVMELKDREIAELMGLNEKTVNKRYQRLLLRCRDILEAV